MDQAPFTTVTNENGAQVLVIRPDALPLFLAELQRQQEEVTR